jgi:hypothetical protein
MNLWVGEEGLEKGGGARERGIECILFDHFVIFAEKKLGSNDKQKTFLTCVFIK